MAVTFLTNEDETRILKETEAGKLLYTQQTLTDTQKAQARENIGAVSAQEVSLSGKKTYKQIATITVAPDADGTLPQHVVFSTDSDGNAFQLTDFMVKAYAGFVDGSTSSLNVAVNGTNAISGSAIPSISTELRGFNVFFRQESDSFVRAEHTVSVGNANVYNPAGRIAASFLIPAIEEYIALPVRQVDLYTNAGTSKAWVEGSTFELWGVLA